MKIETHYPKFPPNTQVLFYNFSKNELVMATVEYCKYSSLTKEWKYSLAGWGTDFEEEFLQEIGKHKSGLIFGVEF